MDEFENRIIKGSRFECHATRWIASWIKSGNPIRDRRYTYSKFAKWLRSEGISEDDIRYICNLSTNGKLELESSAKMFKED